MNTKENKEYRKLILEINSAKDQTQLWKADKNIRQFIGRIERNYPAEARTIAKELYDVSIARHNNLLNWKQSK